MSLITILLWFAATFIFILGPIILVHELGHFLAAKRAGVRVEEFGFGFPPRMVIVAGEEGEMAVSGTPIKIPGRIPLPLGLARGNWVEALVQLEGDGTYRLVRLKPLDKDIPDRPEREETEEGILLRGRLNLYEPGTRYSLNWIPFGAFVRMTGEEDPTDPHSLAAQPKRWRVAVLAAGPVLNLVAAFLLLIGGYTTGHPELFHVRVGEVVENSAAEAAGLQAGDVIVRVEGDPAGGTTPLEAYEQVQSIIQQSAGEPMTLTVQRDGERLTLTAVPERLENGQGRLGILMLDEEDPAGTVYYSLPGATVEAAKDIGYVFSTIFMLPRMLVQGEVEPADVQPTSIVGINEILTISLQQSLETGRAWYTLQTAAMISVALGLTNLLPLPALDGGRILFILIEAIRGRRIRPEIEAAIHFAGMIILLALVMFIMLQDIFNPVIPWSFLDQ